MIIFDPPPNDLQETNKYWSSRNLLDSDMSHKYIQTFCFYFRRFVLWKIDNFLWSLYIHLMKQKAVECWQINIVHYRKYRSQTSDINDVFSKGERISQSLQPNDLIPLMVLCCGRQHFWKTFVQILSYWINSHELWSMIKFPFKISMKRRARELSLSSKYTKMVVSGLDATSLQTMRAEIQIEKAAQKQKMHTRWSKKLQRKKVTDE